MPLTKERWGYVAVLVGMAVALAVILRFSSVVPGLTFRNVTAESLQNLLFSLLLIATFKERAQEIYVIAWRQEGRYKKEQAVKDAAEDEQKKAAAESELQTYRATTGRYVSLVSLSSGFFISLAGVRVLSPLVQTAGMSSGQQEWLFVVDVLLTAGLLAGGSKMIHEVMAVVSEALGRTRGRLAKSPAEASSAPKG